MKKFLFMLGVVAVATLMTSCENTVRNKDNYSYPKSTMPDMIIKISQKNVQTCDSILMANDYAADGELKENGWTQWKRMNVGTITRSASSWGDRTKLFAQTYFKEYEPLYARMWALYMHSIPDGKGSFSGIIDGQRYSEFEAFNDALKQKPTDASATYEVGNTTVTIKFQYEKDSKQYSFYFEVQEPGVK